jgi:hypothetical protein
MGTSIKRLNLTQNNFSELELLIEELSGYLYINDSYFSGVNVAVEQFYQWTFTECGARISTVTFDINLDRITIGWIFDKEMFGMIKSAFSGEISKACDIVLQIIDRIDFDDDSATIQFQFLLTNNFEKVYVSRATVLTDYYHKNRVTDNVHHDIF